MKPIKPILTLCLIACLLITPAAAADTTSIAEKHPAVINPNTPLQHHPLGYSLNDVRAAVAEIHADKTLKPMQKMQAHTEACGMDARLQAWLDAPRDKETGEPIYSANIPVITPILATFGLVKTTPSEPYTQDEGQKVWDAYHTLWLETYVPSGAFGEVIV